MSIKLMTIVWEKFPASGSELLAMLALTDWAADDGGSVYPSMAAVAAKIRLSEKQARRIVQGFVADGYLILVGNEHGGAPGATKQFRINVGKLAGLPSLPNPKTRTAPASVTPPSGVTPPASVTPPMDVRDGSHGCPETAPMGVPGRLPPMGAKPPLEPPIEPPVNHQGSPALCSAVAAVPARPPEVLPAAKPARTRKAKAELEPADETKLQAACRATWAAYSAAYQARYGVPPVRNEKVNSAIKGFVKRIGYEESPAVAEFYVSSVNDAFIVRMLHDAGLLLSGAEGYRTQWATGRAVTATAAKQADQTAANYSAVDEAKAIIRARRAARAAGEEVL